MITDGFQFLSALRRGFGIGHSNIFEGVKENLGNNSPGGAGQIFS
jgi:hypothetical protein